MASGKFDGKDTPALGMMAGIEDDIRFKKVNGSSFEMTSKLMASRCTSRSTRCSSDGKTLTIKRHADERQGRNLQDRSSTGSRDRDALDENVQRRIDRSRLWL